MCGGGGARRRGRREGGGRGAAGGSLDAGAVGEAGEDGGEGGGVGGGEDREGARDLRARRDSVVCVCARAHSCRRDSVVLRV